MNQQFYIVVNGQQQGPFSIPELKGMNLGKDTLVWTEGLDKWTKAEYVPLLKDILKVIPPPIPKAFIPPPNIPAPPVQPPVAGKYFGYELAGRRERFFAHIIQSVIFLIPLLIVFGAALFEDDGFSGTSFILEIIAGAVIGVLSGLIFYPMWSGNLGHRILGLKVVSASDGKDFNSAGQGVSREVLKGILSPFILPTIWIFWDNNKQTLWDKAVNGYVVKKK